MIRPRIELRREHVWRAAGLVIALAIVCLGKEAYRGASAADLSWILAPTAGLVSLTSGADFSYEAGAGWVSRDASFIIAPACAGVHFALAALLTLSFAWMKSMRSARSASGRLVLAACLAYVATLLVNTARITVAIALHLGTLDVGSMDRGDLHRAEGILVYLGGLCLLYALARGLEARDSRALPA